MTIRMLTAAVATSVCVLGSGSAHGQPQQPQSQQPRPSESRMDRAPMDEIVVQGCLSRDASAHSASAPKLFLLRRADSSPGTVSGGAPPPAGTASPSAPAQGPAGQHNAHAEAMQAKRNATPAAGGPDSIYRVIPASAAVNLEPHLGHRVEVRGHIAGPGSGTPAGAPTRGGNQAVQGGQMQGVGQTMQSGQGGQSGQSTQPTPGSQPGQPTAAADGPAGSAVQHTTLTVTSVRMISASCGATP